MFLFLGWGLLSTTRNISSTVLREVNLKVVDSATCSHHYYDLNPISDTQFCTYAKNRDTCEVGFFYLYLITKF